MSMYTTAWNSYLRHIKYRIKLAVIVIQVKICIQNEVKIIIDFSHDILKRLITDVA